jgi:hypothetical protein
LFTVPNGTWVVMPTYHNQTIGDDYGGAIESGKTFTPGQWNAAGQHVYGPGDVMPNYTLHPNANPVLEIQWHPQLGAPQMVSSDTTLSNLVQPNQGYRYWAACMVDQACYPSHTYVHGQLHGTANGNYYPVGSDGNLYAPSAGMSFFDTPMNPPPGATGFPGYGGHPGGPYPGLPTDDGQKYNPTAPAAGWNKYSPSAGWGKLPPKPTSVVQPPPGFPDQPSNYHPGSAGHSAGSSPPAAGGSGGTSTLGAAPGTSKWPLPNSQGAGAKTAPPGTRP